MTVDGEVARSEYERWHRRLEVDRAGDTPWHRLLLNHLELARDLSGKRVLEIACGRGGFACRLAVVTSPGPRLVAADFSFNAVSKGKQFGRELGVTGVRWEVGDAQSLCHSDATFDTVISCETIEHLPDPRAALAEFARVLKPGGRLLVTTPNYAGLLGLYRVYARAVGRPYTEEGQPINRFMLLPRAVRWLKRAGFRIIAVDARGHYLPWPGRPPIELRFLDRSRALRWFALHSLVVAQKPGAAPDGIRQNVHHGGHRGNTKKKNFEMDSLCPLAFRESSLRVLRGKNHRICLHERE